MGRLRHAEVRDLWDTMCEDGASVPCTCSPVLGGKLRH